MCWQRFQQEEALCAFYPIITHFQCLWLSSRLPSSSLTALVALVSFAPTVRAASSTPEGAPVGSAAPVDDPVCTQPPSNVDHSTFTPAQLDLYGLPHRAQDQSLAEWQQIVRAAKH